MMLKAHPRLKSACTALAFGFAAYAGTPAPALAQKAPVAKTALTFLNAADPPYGYRDWCQATSHCDLDDKTIKLHPFSISAGMLAELDEVNTKWNKKIAPASDLEVYGVSEKWTMPVDRGDCEDYAIAKRDELLRKGWPRSRLLFTVVLDEKGEGHAVLTVYGDNGIFVLDNKTDEIKSVDQTPYEFVMSQNPKHPRKWVNIAVGTPQISVAASKPASKPPVLKDKKLKTGHWGDITIKPL